jgi:hypothetical protein
VPLSWARHSREELPDDIIAEMLTDGDDDFVNGGDEEQKCARLISQNSAAYYESTG